MRDRKGVWAWRCSHNGPPCGLICQGSSRLPSGQCVMLPGSWDFEWDSWNGHAVAVQHAVESALPLKSAVHLPEKLTVEVPPAMRSISVRLLFMRREIAKPRWLRGGGKSRLPVRHLNIPPFFIYHYWEVINAHQNWMQTFLNSLRRLSSLSARRY